MKKQVSVKAGWWLLLFADRSFQFKVCLKWKSKIALELEKVGLFVKMTEIEVTGAEGPGGAPMGGPGKWGLWGTYCPGRGLCSCYGRNGHSTVSGSRALLERVGEKRSQPLRRGECCVLLRRSAVYVEQTR